MAAALPQGTRPPLPVAVEDELEGGQNEHVSLLVRLRLADPRRAAAAGLVLLSFWLGCVSRPEAIMRLADSLFCPARSHQVRILNEAWAPQPADRPSFVQLTRTIRAARTRGGTDGQAD